MKTFECDICGRSTGEFSLRTLYDDIQPEDINHACQDCYNTIVDAKIKIDAALNPLKRSWIKRIIISLKERQNEKTT